MAVVEEPKTDQLEDHLEQEDPREEVVEYVECLSLKLALVVGVHGEGDGVADDQHKDEEVEGYRSYHVVSATVAAILLGPHASVPFMISLVKVLDVVSELFSYFGLSVNLICRNLWTLQIFDVLLNL